MNTAACCATLPARARLRHHEPMGSDCDGIDYESLAAILAVVAVAIAAFTQLNHNLSHRGPGKSASGKM